MEDATPVYVFRSADDRFVGMTVMSDGRNLLSLGPAEVWVQEAVASLSKDSLAVHVGDAITAVANLILRGYHVSRSPAVVLPFPRAHRDSS
jgi:hypothetical protein